MNEKKKFQYASSQKRMKKNNGITDKNTNENNKLQIIKLKISNYYYIEKESRSFH